MYQQFYGLGERPFSLLPDPDFLYLSAKHRTALDMLELSIYNQNGFCVISGEIGAGKTTLIRELLNRIDRRVSVGLVSNTHPSFGELLQWVAAAFGLALDTADKLELHKRFIDFVIAQYAQNRHTLLIVDEAQNLSVDALEELRMLSNVNSDKDFVLQIMLVGQPQLRDKLRAPALRQFAQRIALDYHLEKLDEEETATYIRHRLQLAGAAPDLFSDAACRAVARHTQGTPRLINRMCDLALVYGFSVKRTQIDAAMIEQVAEDGHLGAMAGINVPALRDTAVTEEALSPVPEAAHPRPKTTARPEAEASAHPSQETAPPKPEVHPLPSEPSAPAVPEPVPSSIHEAARVRPVEKAQPAEQPVPKTPAAIPQQPQEAAVTQPEAVPQPVNKTARPDVAPLLTEQTTPEEVIAARQRTAAAVSRDTSAGEETPPEAETEDGPAGADLDLHRLVVENLRQAQQSQPRRAGRSLLWVLALLLVGGAAGGGWATRDRWVEPARVRMQDFSVLAATAGHELAIAGKAAAVQVSALLARAGQALQTLQQSGPAAPVAAGDHDKPDAQDEPVPAAAVPVTAEPEPQPSSDGQNRVQEPGTMAETQTLRANDTPNTRHTVPPEPVPATDGSVAGIAVVPVSAETQTAELKQQAEQLEQLRLNAEKLAREREAAERRLAQEQAARKAAERRARIERERLQTAQAAARRAREERQLQEAAAARAAAAQQPAPARQSAVVAAPVVLPVAGTETVSAPVVAEAPLQPAAAASRSSVAVPAETRAAVAEKEKVEFSIDPCNGPKARFMSTCR